MRTVIANRSDFFPKDGCPIALRTIQGDQPVQHEGDLTDTRHSHDFSELIIITSGGGEHWINGVTYPVSAGDIFLIQGKTEHYFEKRHNLGMFNIMFDDAYLKEHLHSLRSLSGFNAFFLFEPTYRRSHKFKSRLHVTPEAMRPLMPLLQQMQDELKQDYPGSDLILLAKALEQNSIPCRLEIGPEGGHGFADGSGMCMAGWTGRAMAWFETLTAGGQHGTG